MSITWNELKQYKLAEAIKICISSLSLKKGREEEEDMYPSEETGMFYVLYKILCYGIIEVWGTFFVCVKVNIYKVIHLSMWYNSKAQITAYDLS